MPPKKKATSKATEAPKKKHQEDKMISSDSDIDAGEDEYNDDEDKMSVDEESNPKKRKSPPTEPANEPDTKTTKQSQNQDTSDASHQHRGDASVRDILNFLLSADSLPLCYPKAELEAGKDQKTKSYALTPPCNFTPFEQLVTAHMLSKPLSHVLGMRSIRTLLNPPYALNTAQQMLEAGEDKIWQALEDARTQHRQKTASYLYQLAKTYSESDTMLALAEEANEQGAGGVIEHIKSTVKGMGQIGAEIFCRRIQCVDGWGDAVWPYADPKTIDALRQLGVEVADGDEVQTLVEEHVDWQKVGQMGLRRLTGVGRDVVVEDDTAEHTGDVDEMDHEQRVQVEFVVLLERAVGAVLEGNAEEVKKQAASAASSVATK